MERRVVTFGELVTEFGGTALGWGKPLTDVRTRFHKHGLPLLPCLVLRFPASDFFVYWRSTITRWLERALSLVSPFAERF